MSILDGTIVSVYLVFIVGVGIAQRGHQEGMRDFFSAQRGFGGFLGTILVGLSLGATMFTALSVVSFPSIIYSYGVTGLTIMIGYVPSYFVLRYWFLQRYLAERCTSPYEIIERQLGRPARLASSAMFCLLRLCWMATLIYATVLLILATCSLGQDWLWPLVLLLGFGSTFYAAVGGIRGVIVTDAIQFAFIILVLAATIVCIMAKGQLSTMEAMEYLRAKTGLMELSWSWDPDLTITVWAMVLGGGLLNLSAFTADQLSLQRYLASIDVATAARAVALSMGATIVVLFMLAGVGLLLAVWYGVRPDAGLPQDPDRIFPYFVATQLPRGFIGITLAAILASTVSSITGGMNALAGALLNDFSKTGPRGERADRLRAARWTTAAVGVTATLLAGFVNRLGSIFEITNAFYGVYMGPLLACMLLAVSHVQIRSGAMVGAMIAGTLAGGWVVYLPIANIWAATAAAFVTVAFAWLGRLRVVGTT